MRKADPGRLDSRERFQVLKDFGKSHVPISEDILFPDATLFICQEMPGSHIAHVDDVQARIQIGGHATVEVIHDDLPGRGGFVISGSHRCARMHHNNGKTHLLEFLGLALRKVLGPLVMADHVVQRDRHRFVGWRAVFSESKSPHAARVNHAPDTGVQRGLEYICSAVHVVRIDFRGILGPEPVVCGHVKQSIAALHGIGEHSAVPEVPDAPLDRKSVNARVP